MSHIHYSANEYDTYLDLDSVYAQRQLEESKNLDRGGCRYLVIKTSLCMILVSEAAPGKED